MANRSIQKALALGLTAVTAATLLLTGCGGSNGGGSGTDSSANAPAQTEQTPETQPAATDSADASEEKKFDGPAEVFTFTVSMPDVDAPYEHWDDNPAVQQWLTDCGENIAIEWNEAPATADSDFYNTLIATGEYTDILSPTLSSSTAVQLYNEGIALDLKDLVLENMPNYMKWIDEHPSYRPQLFQNVEGTERVVALRSFAETTENWSGMIYRRDWILEYGKNPETGEPFTGGWNDDKTEWEDDIVFPGGETYPKYISDWEWMLQIFEDALEALGVTDGAPMTLKYNGYYGGQAPIQCGFGGTFSGWQETRDGSIEYGWTDNSDANRAYVECMHHWYEEGWIDQTFDERTSDSVFFMVNQAAVYSGKVGLCYGLLESQLGNMMNTGTGDPLLENICNMCAPQPINDVYGPESVQNVEPWHYYEAGSLLHGEMIITEKAKDKDLGALLRAIDYLYSEEGMPLYGLGVSDEQQAEHQYQAMIDMGLEDGAYTKKTDENGETVYVVNRKMIDGNYGVSCSMDRMQFGIYPNAHYDKQNSPIMEDALEKSALYPGGGDIRYLTDVLPSDQADEMSSVSTAVTTILDVSIPDFITGRVEINDANWEAFQNSLKEQGVDQITEYIRAMQ